jgi:subtilisin-like proprotein convertase family protein
MLLLAMLPWFSLAQEKRAAPPALSAAPRSFLLLEIEPLLPHQSLADWQWPEGARIYHFPFAPRHVAVSLPAADAGKTLRAWAQAHSGIVRVESLTPRQLQKKWLPNDARFAQQWHLLNTGQNGGLPGMDLQLTNVWETFQGAGIVVAIVDDGVELTHRDLQDNANPLLSYDYLDDDTNAAPSLFSDTHGTQVAGVAAARGNNGLGVCGVAPQATLASVRLISGPTTDAQEALALSHALDRVHIMNCSWGALDGQRKLAGPGPLTVAAMQHGVEVGRGGRGVIYVISAGNGGQDGEDANMDGYVNALTTLAVGAVDDLGRIAPYSEGGACVHVVAPSGASLRQKIVTTDLTGLEGDDPSDYTAEFTGTSAAAPSVAGIVALVLEANPRIGWRDVQEILLRTARPLDTQDGGWITNAAGFRFHPRCGAGLAQAQPAVTLARQWVPLPPQTHWAATNYNLPLAIPDPPSIGVTLTFQAPPLPLRVEHVIVRLSVAHSDLSQVEISLQSPSGTASLLLPANALDATATLQQWPFSSVRHWGELAGGTWRVTVRDVRFLQTGTVTEAQLHLYGALLPEPALSRQSPQTLLLSLPMVAGVSPVLETSTQLDSWAPMTWSGWSNGAAFYLDDFLNHAQKFYRVRWTQP